MIEINEKPIQDVYINDKLVDKILFNNNLIFKRIPNNIIESISLSEVFYYKVGWGDYTWLGTTPNVLTKFDLGKDPIWNLVFTNNVDVTYVDLTKVDLTNCGNGLYEMFQNCPKLETIKFGDLSNISQSNTMARTFYECSSLKELDLSTLTKTISLENTFFNCSSLNKLNISNLDTSNCSMMYYTFFHCDSLLELDLSHFDTSNVTNMSNMFRYCKSLKKLDLSSFNTSKVTNMETIFSDCDSLEELDISNFDISNIPTSGQNIFGFIEKLKKIKCKRSFYNAWLANKTNFNLPWWFDSPSTTDHPYEWILVD